MKKIHLIFLNGLLFTLMAIPAFGQFSGAYYGGNQSKVGLAYDMGKRTNIEVKIYASVELNQFIPELSLTYKFLKRDMYSVYSGITAYSYLDFDYYGPGIPLGTVIRPIPFINSVAFQIEIMPYWNQDVEFAIQNSWAVRYYF